MKKTMLLIIISLFTFNIFAQIDNPTTRIKINYNDNVDILPNKSFFINIDVEVPKFNHIYLEYLNDNSFSFLTKIEMDQSSDFEIISIKKPQGEKYLNDLVLRGKGTFAIEIRNKKNIKLKDKGQIWFKFITQMCNEKNDSCYMPYTFQKEINYQQGIIKK
ncbi:MAG: hypothetical protein A2086_04325 [Spirochaetes bacterium GWD1_27_9]|nr:MAG: hypothetical protein A2Z98_06090 [Spirochaetes bacterium GWB1_27_13]OHD41384.1 MAG: hypothetical protein A2086_04325 [Spirochaetes bacterium GWD1_27_9]